MKSTVSFQANKSLEAMLNDCSIDAIIAIDANKNIIAWNSAAETIHGITKKEAIGKPVTDVIPSVREDEETLQAIDLAANGIQSFVPALKKYRHRLHVENHFIPLKDAAGSPVGVMNISHDVAHRIKAEQQLEKLNGELEKRYRQLKTTSDELASFTYITTNSVKEPIRQIYTGIEHLIKVEASRLTNTGKATFRRIQSSISRMDILLNDIISLSQISIPDKPQTLVNTKEVVDDVTAALQNKITEKNAVIETGELCAITGHTDQLFVLLSNLVDNAIKFNSSPVPKVYLDCKEVIVNESSNTNLEDYHCLSVTDNGIGISKDDSERIFRMFEKLNGKNYKGSGAGLAIARKIMEVHDGFITVESHETGSSFHCFFPLKEITTIPQGTV